MSQHTYIVCFMLSPFHIRLLGCDQLYRVHCLYFATYMCIEDSGCLRLRSLDLGMFQTLQTPLKSGGFGGVENMHPHPQPWGFFKPLHITNPARHNIHPLVPVFPPPITPLVPILLQSQPYPLKVLDPTQTLVPSR